MILPNISFYNHYLVAPKCLLFATYITNTPYKYLFYTSAVLGLSGVDRKSGERVFSYIESINFPSQICCKTALIGIILNLRAILTMSLVQFILSIAEISFFFIRCLVAFDQKSWKLFSDFVLR